MPHCAIGKFIDGLENEVVLCGFSPSETSASLSWCIFVAFLTILDYVNHIIIGACSLRRFRNGACLTLRTTNNFSLDTPQMCSLSDLKLLM
ncbi:hypothetical protein AcV5_010102 [Taiwanofungus camphoratus]|nr:hypothetical protein AcV5_010102 [Antrodia cinnamomea]